MATKTQYDDMTAFQYVNERGIPPIDMYKFPLEVVMQVHNRYNEQCAICSKHRRGENLGVVHIKVPDLTDVRSQPQMLMKNFRRLDNAILLCTQCGKAYKAGDAGISAKVKAIRRPDPPITPVSKSRK
jgi:5-methylcytosine-specific restriction endonuclease McrA